MKKDVESIVILGSTGSIGLSTLDVISRHHDKYRIKALTANTQVDRLFDQCQRFQPETAVMVNAEAAAELRKRITASGMDISVESGVEGLIKVAAAEATDVVMAAIVGAAGLLPTLEAVKVGKRVLFANKEPLVMCGNIFIERARRSGATLLPIDSEHNAIFQCMPSGYRTGDSHKGIKRILLTGSGGPFRTVEQSALESVTPEQACSHPNWDMGKKISVDSATLMNKGLELIEACWLFNVSPEEVQVIIHSQSIVHSMVEYADGSVLAQMGNPDMRTPIAHALAWPDRIESGVASLNLFDTGRLDFELPDMVRFPCLALAYRAARAGGIMPAVLNAANEVAVDEFLQGNIPFLAIAETIDTVLTNTLYQDAEDLNVILEADSQARIAAREYINRSYKKQTSETG